jgi:hypothetical protein
VVALVTFAFPSPNHHRPLPAFTFAWSTVAETTQRVFLGTEEVHEIAKFPRPHSCALHGIIEGRVHPEIFVHYVILAAPITGHVHVWLELLVVGDATVIYMLMSRLTLGTITVNNTHGTFLESVVETGGTNIARNLTIHAADVRQTLKHLHIFWGLGIVVGLALASTTATFEIFLKLCASKPGFTPLVTCLAQTFVLVAFFVQIAAFATPAITAVFLLKFFARITFRFGPGVASFFLAGLWTFFLVALRIRFETVEKIVDHGAIVNFFGVTFYLLPTLETTDLDASGRCAHNVAIAISRPVLRWA